MRLLFPGDAQQPVTELGVTHALGVAKELEHILHFFNVFPGKNFQKPSTILRRQVVHGTPPVSLLNAFDWGWQSFIPRVTR
jgi:hypothetical protein